MLTIPILLTLRSPNYLMYLDANNLYGWFMSQSLSTHEFCWLNFEEKRTIEVYSTPLDEDTGQVFEVDHTYPMELHDYQNE